MLAPILAIGSQLIDKLIPDKDAANKAKQDLATMEQNGELKIMQMQLDDVANARAREIATHDTFTKVLASCITGGYFGIIAMLKIGDISPSELSTYSSLIQTCQYAFLAVVGYYFGYKLIDSMQAKFSKK